MLTPKQRSALRSLANDLQPIFQVGKQGINDNLIKQVNDALEARELIKLTALTTAPLGAREACEALAAATNAEAVFAIGNRFVLFRPSKEAKNRKIFID
jgi:RNA-binding protein